SLCDGEGLDLALDRARAGHERQLIAPDRAAPHGDHGVVRLELAARELEGHADASDRLDRGELLHLLPVHEPRLAERCEPHVPVVVGAVDAQARHAQPGREVVHDRLAHLAFEHHQHGFARPYFSRPRRARCRSQALASTIAIMLSATGTTRGQMHGSWRPSISIAVVPPCFVAAVWRLPIEVAGRTATRTTTGAPSELP